MDLQQNIQLRYYLYKFLSNIVHKSVTCVTTSVISLFSHFVLLSYCKTSVICKIHFTTDQVMT